MSSPIRNKLEQGMKTLEKTKATAHFKERGAPKMRKDLKKIKELGKQLKAHGSGKGHRKSPSAHTEANQKESSSEGQGETETMRNKPRLQELRKPAASEEQQGDAKDPDEQQDMNPDKQKGDAGTESDVSGEKQSAEEARSSEEQRSSAEKTRSDPSAERGRAGPARGSDEQRDSQESGTSEEQRSVESTGFGEQQVAEGSSSEDDSKDSEEKVNSEEPERSDEPQTRGRAERPGKQAISHEEKDSLQERSSEEQGSYEEDLGSAPFDGFPVSGRLRCETPEKRHGESQTSKSVEGPMSKSSEEQFGPGSEEASSALETADKQRLRKREILDRSSRKEPEASFNNIATSFFAAVSRDDNDTPVRKRVNQNHTVISAATNRVHHQNHTVVSAAANRVHQPSATVRTNSSLPAPTEVVRGPPTTTPSTPRQAANQTLGAANTTGLAANSTRALTVLSTPDPIALHSKRVNHQFVRPRLWTTHGTQAPRWTIRDAVAPRHGIHDAAAAMQTRASVLAPLWTASPLRAPAYVVLHSPGPVWADLMGQSAQGWQGPAPALAPRPRARRSPAGQAACERDGAQQGSCGRSKREGFAPYGRPLPATSSSDAPYEYVRIKTLKINKPFNRITNKKVRADASTGEEKNSKPTDDDLDDDDDDDDLDDDREVGDADDEEELPELLPVVEHLPVVVIRRPKQKFKTSKTKAKRANKALQDDGIKLTTYRSPHLDRERDTYKIQVSREKPEQTEQHDHHDQPEEDTSEERGPSASYNYDPNARPVSPSEYMKRLKGAHLHFSPGGRSRPHLPLLQAGSGFYNADRPPRWSSSYMLDERSRPRGSAAAAQPPWDRLRQERESPSRPSSRPPRGPPGPGRNRASLPPRSVYAQIHMGSSQQVPSDVQAPPAPLSGGITLPQPYLLDIVKKYPVKIRVVN